MFCFVFPASPLEPKPLSVIIFLFMFLFCSGSWIQSIWILPSYSSVFLSQLVDKIRRRHSNLSNLNVCAWGSQKENEMRAGAATTTKQKEEGRKEEVGEANNTRSTSTVTKKRHMNRWFDSFVLFSQPVPHSHLCRERGKKSNVLIPQTWENTLVMTSSWWSLSSDAPLFSIVSIVSCFSGSHSHCDIFTPRLILHSGLSGRLGG